LDLDKLKHRKLSLVCLGFTSMRGGCITASSIVLLIEAIIRSCDLSVQIIFVPITTQDIQFLSACVFVAFVCLYNSFIVSVFEIL
jgi:hypothetical protein